MFHQNQILIENTYLFQNYLILYEFDIDTDKNLLEEYTQNCDFVYHLAGVNRPEKDEEFIENNS